MIELPPISPSYPVKKPNKIIREQKQSDKQQSSEEQKEDEDEQTNEPPAQHIDEIV